jgi:hypothetical protein
MDARTINRGFHRLGLFLAAVALAIGAVLTAGDLVRMEPYTLPRDITFLTVAILMGILMFGTISFCVYGIVRAIGWVVGGFARPE